ncbi:MAG: anti-sigma factor family protein [Bacteroidota bacterium]
MNYKPDEKDWMAYLYGELEGPEKDKMDQYLISNADARKEFEKLQNLRGLMRSVEDKEVIAPPIFLDDNKQRFIWNAPYFKTIVSIAASLLLIMLVGRFTNTQVSVGGNEFKLTFGAVKKAEPVKEVQQASLTPDQVQQMINTSLQQNNTAMETSWQENQKKLDASIRKNLAVNSGKIDQLVREASNASRDQIRDYVANMQTENTQLVKDYFELTSNDQKKYIESLLVDFAKYLQQQRNDDLMIVQSRLNNIEQNTTLFKQETEQILTSIISTVGNNTATKETRN